MKEIGSTIRQRDMEFTRIWMEPNTKAIGRRINSMAEEQSHGQMVLSMRVITSTEKSMAKEDFSGRMDQFMWVSSRITTSRDKESILGQMVVPLTGLGLQIRCTAKVFSLGQTIGDTRVSILKTRSLVLARFTGPTEESTSASGSMGNSTGGVPLLQSMANRETENGTKERESGGLMNDTIC